MSLNPYSPIQYVFKISSQTTILYINTYEYTLGSANTVAASPWSQPQYNTNNREGKLSILLCSACSAMCSLRRNSKLCMCLTKDSINHISRLCASYMENIWSHIVLKILLPHCRILRKCISKWNLRNIYSKH